MSEQIKWFGEEEILRILAPGAVVPVDMNTTRKLVQALRQAKYWPCYEDPLSQVHERDKYRASVLRTLVCMAEILRLRGHTDAHLDLIEKLKKENGPRFDEAFNEIEKGIHSCITHWSIGVRGNEAKSAEGRNTK